MISSESCSFPSISAKLIRDIQPGEIIKLERNKAPRTLAIIPRPSFNDYPAFCIFEYVYFSKPDSFLEGQMVYTVRKNCGRQLAIEAPVPNSDKSKWLVSAVPESSMPAAFGYSEQVGLTFNHLNFNLHINISIYFIFVVGATFRGSVCKKQICW